MLHSALYKSAYQAGERRAAADHSADPSYFPPVLNVTRGTLFSIIRAAYPDLQQPGVTLVLWRRKNVLLETYRAAYYLRRYTLASIRAVPAKGA